MISEQGRSLMSKQEWLARRPEGKHVETKVKRGEMRGQGGQKGERKGKSKKNDRNEGQRKQKWALMCNSTARI